MSIENTIELLAELVAFPSVSTDSNLKITHHLAARLEDAGAAVQVLPSACGRKANLVARLGPDAPGGLLLSGHTDVVPVAGQAWSSDPFTLRRDDDKVYGRGTCDMKGFIAAAVTLAGQITPPRPIHFAFTHDEEVGCLGARALMPQLAAQGIKPDQVLVGEPTGMRVVEGHKGCCEYTIRFQGRAGHGSNPGAGVNAAEYAVRYASKFLELRGKLMLRAGDDPRFTPPWPTLNIGQIVGGAAHNVIAESAELNWEMRPMTDADRDMVLAELEAEIALLEPQMQAIAPEAFIETIEIGNVPGLIPTAKNSMRDALLPIVSGEVGLVPFNTEAGLFQRLGAHVAVCGPGHIAEAHTADEYLEIAQLEQCLEMLSRLMTQA